MKIKVFESKLISPLCCLMGGFAALLLLAESLAVTGWGGHDFLWYEHVDQWQSLLHASYWGSPSRSAYPEMVFARIPGWFPDLLIARISLIFGGGYGVRALTFEVIIRFFAYIYLAASCLRYVSGNNSFSNLSYILFFQVSLFLCLPGLGLAFVPMHHGGNIFSTILIFLAFCGWSEGGSCSKASIIVLLSLVGTASNRFFLVSGLLPVLTLLVCSGLRRAKKIAFLCASISAASLFLRPALMQGRDSFPLLDFSLLPSSLWLRLSDPAVMILVFSFFLSFVCLITAGAFVSIRSVASQKALRHSRLSSFLWFCSSSILFSCVAELFVTGFDSPHIATRYLFAPLLLVPVLMPLCVNYLWNSMILFSRYFTGRMLSLACCGWFAVVLLFAGAPDFAYAQTRSSSIISTLRNESLPSRYGLATYPHWQGGALTGLTNGEFDIMEASSDGTPMFWHRWKGALFNGGELKPFSFVLVSPHSQDRVVGHYGEPSRKVFCEKEDYECLWIYQDNRLMISDLNIFVDTYGDKLKD